MAGGRVVRMVIGMNKALIEDPQNDVDGKNSDNQQDSLRIIDSLNVWAAPIGLS